MEPSEAVEDIAGRLASLGFKAERVNIAGHDALVARHSAFRLKWAATRLHTFVVVFVATALDDRIAEELTAAAQQYAIEHKGGLPRGLQNGTATVAVFLSAGPQPAVRRWFSAEPNRRWAALRFPVLIELDAGRPTYFTGRVLWGALYAEHIGEVIGAVIGPLVRPGS